MSEECGVARTPEEFFPLVAKAFSSLNIEKALKLFDGDCIMIAADGTVHRGKCAIARELEVFFGMGIEMQTVQRHLFVSGDTASMICDWSLEGIANDGSAVNLRGTAFDVLRQGIDGSWRYIIDNPFGVGKGVAG